MADGKLPLCNHENVAVVIVVVWKRNLRRASLTVKREPCFFPSCTPQKRPRTRLPPHEFGNYGVKKKGEIVPSDETGDHSVLLYPAEIGSASGRERV